MSKVGDMLKPTDIMTLPNVNGMEVKLSLATKLCDCKKGDVFVITKYPLSNNVSLLNKRTEKRYILHVSDVYEIVKLPEKDK